MEVMEARELLEEAQTEDEVQELKNVNDSTLSCPSRIRVCITETQGGKNDILLCK